uniref:Uncharacterized protein n=1 Tax=Anguilla anguilla TaxID=7936 RepID=A0A0E9Q3H6_ANGAN
MFQRTESLCTYSVKNLERSVNSCYGPIWRTWKKSQVIIPQCSINLNK